MLRERLRGGGRRGMRMMGRLRRRRRFVSLLLYMSVLAASLLGLNIRSLLAMCPEQKIPTGPSNPGPTASAAADNASPAGSSDQNEQQQQYQEQMPDQIFLQRQLQQMMMMLQNPNLCALHSFSLSFPSLFPPFQIAWTNTCVLSLLFFFLLGHSSPKPHANPTQRPIPQPATSNDRHSTADRPAIPLRPTTDAIRSSAAVREGEHPARQRAAVGERKKEGLEARSARSCWRGVGEQVG